MAKLLDGLQFVLTGSFGETRPSVTKKLESLGAISHSSITKTTNLLIAGEDPGYSKIRRAHGMGINIVDREWLVKALAEGGLELEDEKFQVENA